MSLRTALAAAAVLAFAAPAFAQDAPAADPIAAAAAAEAEAAFEARAEVFQDAMKTMQGEMETAWTAAGSDQVKGHADLDAIAARYQPQADTFARDLAAFIASQDAVMPPEVQAQMAQMGPMLHSRIIGAPASIKAGVIEVAAANAPAAAH